VQLELVQLELVQLELVQLELVQLELVQLGADLPAAAANRTEVRAHLLTPW
jgi:hypothetical protein